MNILEKNKTDNKRNNSFSIDSKVFNRLKKILT